MLKTFASLVPKANLAIQHDFYDRISKSTGRNDDLLKVTLLTPSRPLSVGAIRIIPLEMDEQHIAQRSLGKRFKQVASHTPSTTVFIVDDRLRTRLSRDHG